MCSNQQYITKIPTERIRLKCEEKHINKLKTLIWDVSEGEKQLPEHGANKSMGNSVSRMATSKTAATSFASKSRPSAPMVTYRPDMREGDSIAILLRGRLVPHYKLVHNGAINMDINTHKYLALEICFDREAIKLIIDVLINLLVTEVGNVVQKKRLMKNSRPLLIVSMQVLLKYFMSRNSRTSSLEANKPETS